MASLRFVDTHNMIAYLSKPNESEGFEQIVGFLNASHIKRKTRKDTQIPQSIVPTQTPVANEAINKEMYDSLGRVATTGTGLDAGQDSGNILNTQTKETSNESNPNGDDSGDGPWCPETMRGTSAQDRPEAVSKPSYDSQTRGNTLESDEDRLKLFELIETCTNLQRRVLDLETDLMQFKTGHKKEIDTLYKRVKSSDNDSLEEDAPIQGRRSDDNVFNDYFNALEEIEVNDDVDLNVNVDDVANDIVMEENVAKKVVEDVVDVINTAKVLADTSKVSTGEVRVSTASRIVSTASVEVSIAGVEVSAVSRRVSVVGEEVNAVGATTSPTTTTTTTSTTAAPKQKGVVIQEPATTTTTKDRRLREKEEANAAMWDKYEHIQASMEAYRLLAERLQVKERESLTDAEKAAQLMQLIKDRRKFFAEKRAEEKRNQPPIKTQQRRLMCTYLRNMEGYKQKDFIGKTFDEVQKLFDRTKTSQETSKRATDEMESKRTKKQKIDKEKERTDQKLKSFDREDLEDLWKLVKDKYRSTKPKEDMDLLLWYDLKNMLEPHVEDLIWKSQQGYKVVGWKLYESYGVHALMMHDMIVYMLVEKKYPLTLATLTQMLDKKLQTNEFIEMTYQLLKLITKQVKGQI
ncbi:hypothetical protein Tco_0001297 [Tanacetum coccineum]